MALTVDQSFNEFMKDTVNLDSDETEGAIASRNWLVEQIAGFKNTNIDFPTSYKNFNINFGSFARKTKIRELDDIDIMIGLNGQGSTYMEYAEGIDISVSSGALDLLKLCHPNSISLNSKNVINKFVSACSNVHQYSSAEIKRNQEAAVLELNSYPWSFDIVPSFMTSEDNYGNSYYLIPDGNGYWKKTDPRIDRERVVRINQDHDGNVLRVIRIIKYWNRRGTMPTILPYLLETMILNYYEEQSPGAEQFVDLEFPNVIAYIHNKIMGNVEDPKNIQGNINYLSYEERKKIMTKIIIDHQIATVAEEFEQENDMESSIAQWSKIFGSAFPKYY